MWVYTYKLDKHHRLIKCKARLVVRGDQQRNITAQDTYAATLAGRSFRMLMAIAAKFDLELKQYDVTNAFVHAAIDREIYMRMPRGYQKPGTLSHGVTGRQGCLQAGWAQIYAYSCVHLITTPPGWIELQGIGGGTFPRLY
jgi:hypothetical protein